MSTVRSLRNRSSRFSSPATFDNKQDSDAATRESEHENGYENMEVDDSWAEPAPRNPVPSFEDTKGVERQGVLELMQPLGTLPTPKVLQKLKISFKSAGLSARATPLQGEEAASPVTEGAKTDAASPVDPESLAYSHSHPPEQQQPLQEPFQESIARTPPRGRPGKKDVAEMRQAGAQEEGFHSSSPVKATPRTTKGSPRPPNSSIQGLQREERMRVYLVEAQKRACSEGKYELAAGLQRVLDEVKAESAMLPALDSILQGRSQVTLDEFKVFKRFIKKGMRKHRRNVSNQTYSHSDYSVVPPHLSLSYGQSYGQGSPLSPDRTTHQPPSESTITTPLRLKLHYRMGAFNSPPPAESLPQSPSMRARPSIEGSASEELLDNGTPLAKRSRSGSESSVLSSAKSLASERAPPEVVDPEVAAEGRPVRSAGQRQAPSRLPSNRTRLSGTDPPSSKHATDSFKTTNHNHRQRLKLRVGDQPDPDAEEIRQRRREFEQASFYDYNYQHNQDSNVRDPIVGRPLDIPQREGPPSPILHPSSLTDTADALFSPTSQKGADLAVGDQTSRKRSHDEFMQDVASPASSLSPPLSPPPAPIPQHVAVGATGSRASTPRAAKAQPPTRSRKSARVMISPNKSKNGGITAGKPGVLRAGTGREATLANGADSAAEDNEEFCRSCGGEGTLLCCDGCPHSFHHACLEPPLNPDDEIGDEWFCPECQARRKRQPFKPTTLLSLLVHDVEDTYPRAYALPVDIREYFEGVKTGDEGEYEEVALPRTQKNNPRMNRQGLFEMQNYKELRDNKGNLRFCYRCGLTSEGRDIIPCDFCPHEWHLDCVNPPLAVPPRRVIDGKQIGTWRCPLHTEDDLRSLSRQAEAAPGDLGRVPRLRRPREARPKDINLPRGFRNNGIIDVDLEKDEMPDVKETDMGHSVYRLPERGIKLDFIDRVKQTWYEDHAVPRQLGLDATYHEHVYRPANYHENGYRPQGGPVQSKLASQFAQHDQDVMHYQVQHDQDVLRYIAEQQIAENAMANARLRQKSFLEQRVALGLVEMAYPSDMPDQESGTNTFDPVSDLINCLVSDAPDEVTQSINTSEREQLLALQKLVESRLSLLKGIDISINTKPQPPAPEPTAEDADVEADVIRPLSRSRSRNSTTIKTRLSRTRSSDSPARRGRHRLKIPKANGVLSAENTPTMEHASLDYSAYKSTNGTGRVSRTSSPLVNGLRAGLKYEVGDGKYDEEEGEMDVD